MHPLTSPSGCDSCLHLSQTVAELQRQMSPLYQIREEERFLDSLFAESVTTTATTAVHSDPAILAGIPQLEDFMVVTVGAPANGNDTELDATILAALAQPEDHWLQLGAKPKKNFPVLSTPTAGACCP